MSSLKKVSCRDYTLIKSRIFFVKARYVSFKTFGNKTVVWINRIFGLVENSRNLSNCYFRYLHDFIVLNILCLYFLSTGCYHCHCPNSGYNLHSNLARDIFFKILETKHNNIWRIWVWNADFINHWHIEAEVYLKWLSLIRYNFYNRPLPSLTFLLKSHSGYVVRPVTPAICLIFLQLHFFSFVS